MCLAFESLNRPPSQYSSSSLLPRVSPRAEQHPRPAVSHSRYAHRSKPLDLAVTRESVEGDLLTVKLIWNDSPANQMSNQDDHTLGDRIRHRAITAVDLLSILLADAIVLVFSFAFLWFVSFVSSRWTLPAEAAAAFHIAEMMSAALFLILYVVVVGIHIVDFVRTEAGK